MRLPAFCSIMQGLLRMILSCTVAISLCSAPSTRADEVPVRRCIVIPIGFDDLQPVSQDEEYAALISGADEYFKRQFLGKIQVEFIPNGPVTVSRPYAYYGANSTDRKDARIAEAVIEACHILNAETDFSEIDYISVITAGPNESYGADADYFWPQQLKLSDFGLSLVLDGRKFDDFAVSTELGPDGRISGPGDFCHEFGHLLGLKDLYDVDGEGSGGLAPGLSGLALMDTGNRTDGGQNPPDFCCVEYDQTDWCGGKVLEKRSHTLIPSKGNGTYCILPSRFPGKYTLVENRGGSELFLVKINRSNEYAGFSDRMRKILTAEERWALNEINCRPDCQCAEYVRSANGKSFSSDSLAICNITKKGEDFCFDVVEPVVIKNILAFQDGVILDWGSEFSLSFIAEAGIAWWKDGEEMKERKVQVSEDGCFHITIDGLKPKTDYNISIYVTSKDGQPFERAFKIQTEAYREDSFPFIMTDSPGRNPDGSYSAGAQLWLRVRNAPDATSVIWTFNGREIHATADGRWTVPGSGVLKARIYREDGSEDIITKNIRVK